MERHRWWEWLFVYGTLRPEARHVLGQWLEGSCVYGGYGKVRGTLYDLGAYPGMVVGETTEGWVVGELFRFPAWPLGLEVMDRYEGEEYHRVRVEVFGLGGTTDNTERHGRGRDGFGLGAWAYVLWGEVGGERRGCRIGSGDWMRRGEG